jgi:hypothetical protein
MAGAGSGRAGATCVNATGYICAEDCGVVYQFCQGPLNLLESGVACTLIGSIRGKVDDAAENDFIRQGLTDAGLLAAGTDVFLGGTDVVTEGTWAWFDLSVYWDRGAATAFLKIGRRRQLLTPSTAW